jgi:hypothetical protein
MLLLLYLESARRRRKGREETPWFTGDEDKENDQKQHKEGKKDTGSAPL